jgi:hypothetical protein
LNLNPHAHGVFLDGVYEETEEGLVFRSVAAPTSGEIEEVSARIAAAVRRRVASRGAGGEPEGTPVARAAEETRGLLAEVEEAGRVRLIRGAVGLRRTGVVDGFSLHAGVWARGDEEEKRRRMVRYCVRPPLAEKQVQQTADGRIAFELRRARANGATHVVF